MATTKAAAAAVVILVVAAEIHLAVVVVVLAISRFSPVVRQLREVELRQDLFHLPILLPQQLRVRLELDQL